MFNFIRKNFPHFMSSSRASVARNFWFLQSNPLSTSSRKPLRSSIKSNDESVLLLRVNYLVNTLGFPPERAASVSKYMNFQTPEKPDSVILFLKDKGFTHAQILRMAKRYPRCLVVSDPEKTFLPKIEFFRSLGFHDAEIIDTLCARPEIFKRSLKEQLQPSFEFVKGLFPSDVKTLGPLRWYASSLCSDYRTCLVPNVEILREFGVPDENIVSFFKIQCKSFQLNATRFRKIVEEVKDMGFNPLRLNFVLALHAFRAMNKSTWEKKVEIYKKWGCSEDEILEAFRKRPWCMIVSEDKIMAIMELLVNELGLAPSDVVKQPEILSLSLQNRIIPRSIIYQALSKKGLIPKDFNLRVFFKAPEEKFLRRFVDRFQAEAPGLLTLYQKGLPLSTYPGPKYVEEITK